MGIMSLKSSGFSDFKVNISLYVGKSPTKKKKGMFISFMALTSFIITSLQTDVDGGSVYEAW